MATFLAERKNLCACMCVCVCVCVVHHYVFDVSLFIYRSLLIQKIKQNTTTYSFFTLQPRKGTNTNIQAQPCKTTVFQDTISVLP